MSGNHADRGHSTWSASASARNWACPGALRLAAKVEQPPESLAAAWGTACHEVSDSALRSGKDAVDFLGDTIRTKEYSIKVDEEMVETAQAYIDYVRGQVGEGDTLMVEQRFSLDAYGTPFDAGGTADAVILKPAERLLEVVDLKGGRGVVVEATGNPQLRTYALGALTANPDFKAERVKVTIVQPRAPHRDGRIRSEEFSAADLLDWTFDLLAAMDRAAQPDAPLVPGPSQCRFCPALAICPAVREKALAEARVRFDDLGSASVPNTPDDLMPEDIAQILDHADMIQDWLNAVRAYGHRQAESGVVIPGYVLTPKQARRKWRAEDAEIVGKLQDLGVEPFTQKLITPAQADKALGKTRKGEIADLWSAESSGTNLVRKDKTTREAVKPAVDRFFDIME